MMSMSSINMMTYVIVMDMSVTLLARWKDQDAQEEVNWASLKI